MAIQGIKNLYSDLDLTFSKLPTTGDVALRYDDQAVIRSVVNLLLTNFYERPFQPDLGSNMSSFLFEPMSSITASSMKSEIKNVINNYEPRVTISELQITPDELNNLYNVYMEVFIGNNTQVTPISLVLQRSR
jgi:phage baseplate assembly protein W